MDEEGSMGGIGVRVAASAPVARGRLHASVDFATVDASVSVIENFIGLDWIIEVQVTLGNMLAHDSSRKVSLVTDRFQGKLKDRCSTASDLNRIDSKRGRFLTYLPTP